MKFGCCISKIDDLIRVKAAGYDFFEFAGCAAAAMSKSEFDAFCAEQARTGLPCIGFNAYSAGIPAIIGHNVSDSATASYAELLCRRGKRLGISALGIGSPNARRLPADMDKSDADAQFIRFIRIAAGAAKDHGMCVLVEAVHSGMCNYLNGTLDAAEITRLIGLDNVGMVLDFYHMAEMGEDYSLAAAAAPYLRHVHFSTSGSGLWRGFPQKADFDEYRGIFAILKSIGYDGTVSIEPSEFEPEQASSCLELLKRLEAEIK